MCRRVNRFNNYICECILFFISNSVLETSKNEMELNQFLFLLLIENNNKFV